MLLLPRYTVSYDRVNAFISWRRGAVRSADGQTDGQTPSACQSCMPTSSGWMDGPILKLRQVRINSMTLSDIMTSSCTISPILVPSPRDT
eukprot:scaffold208641_cov59-Attheya_sp.AAC.2